MEFGWSEEQEVAYSQARAFAERELDPRSLATRGAAAGTMAERFARNWQACAAFGVLGLNLPTRFGGLALDTRSALRVMEGLGRGTSDNGLLMALGAQLWSVGEPILAFGSEEQQQTWLPRLAAGTAIGAFALSESEAGSDVFHLRTQAVADGGGWRLTGTKAFVTNAPVADVFIVIASTDARAGYFGLTAFLVAAGQPGLSVSPALEKIGIESSPMAEITFDAAFLPQGAVLGSVGGGAAVVQHTLEWERGSLLAPALGTIARLLEHTTSHCRERRQFGRPIADFEAVGGLLAEIRLRLHLARLAVYEFAWRKDQRQSATLEAAMVKLYVSESLRRAAEVALHLHGAAGYMRALDYEREWRDAMASSLYSGTTEIQRNLIAESLLHAPPAPATTTVPVAAPGGEAVAA